MCDKKMLVWSAPAVALVLFVCCSHVAGQNISREKQLVLNVFQCIFQKDHRSDCFFERAERALEDQRVRFLGEADAEFAASLQTVEGRAKAGNVEKPSAIASTVSNIISELTEILSDSLSSFFSDLKGAGDVKGVSSSLSEEDEDEEEEEDEKDVNAVKDAKKRDGKSRGAVEERKKKKKKIHKLIDLIKLLILGAVLKAKLEVVLSLLSAHLQIKFFLIALLGLLINAARFWIDLKKGHHPQKVIYYEHAQHQHHYDDHEEDYHGGGSSGFWGRSSWERDPAATQNGAATGATGVEDTHKMAYSAQRPWTGA